MGPRPGRSVVDALLMRTGAGSSGPWFRASAGIVPDRGQRLGLVQAAARAGQRSAPPAVASGAPYKLSGAMVLFANSTLVVNLCS